MTETGEKLCPFCSETINEAAIICKHCGSNLPPIAIPNNPISYAQPSIKKKPRFGMGCLFLTIYFAIFEASALIISTWLLQVNHVAFKSTSYFIGHATGYALIFTIILAIFLGCYILIVYFVRYVTTKQKEYPSGKSIVVVSVIVAVLLILFDIWLDKGFIGGMAH